MLLAGKLSQAESRRRHERTKYGTERTKYGVAKDRLSSPPFVSMVQAAHLRNGNDTTVLRSIDTLGSGASFARAKCVRDFS